MSTSRAYILWRSCVPQRRCTSIRSELSRNLINRVSWGCKTRRAISYTPQTRVRHAASGTAERLCQSQTRQSNRSSEKAVFVQSTSDVRFAPKSSTLSPRVQTLSVALKPTNHQIRVTPWLQPSTAGPDRRPQGPHNTDILSQRPNTFYHPPRRHISTASPSAPPTPTAMLTDPAHLPAYHPPQKGLLSLLPAPLIPYLELSRLDKPAGTIYLFLPCLFSTLLAAPLTLTTTPPSTVLSTTLLFLLGATIMRGAGCTINDLWDRNLDPKVARTRLRPIARGAVSVPAALTYTCVQLLLGLAVLLQFPQPTCFYYGAPSLLLVATYPLAKRVTHYPQFVLGLTFSWGAFMGFPALGIDLLAPENAQVLAAAGCLYASCVAWTVLYDMIYAHMDIRDDVAAGIKSIALRHEVNTKAVLSGLAVVQLGLLGAAGVAVGAGSAFFAGSCGGAALTLGTMIWRVNLKSVEDCWWWFRYGCYFTGGGIAAGLLGEYIVDFSSA